MAMLTEIESIGCEMLNEIMEGSDKVYNILMGNHP